jgi:hypothetical protein
MRLWGVVSPVPVNPPSVRFGATVHMSVVGPPDFGSELGQWNYTQLVATHCHIKHSTGTEEVQIRTGGLGAGRDLSVSAVWRATPGCSQPQGLGRLAWNIAGCCA